MLATGHMRAESRRAQRRDGGALGTASRRCLHRPPASLRQSTPPLILSTRSYTCPHTIGSERRRVERRIDRATDARARRPVSGTERWPDAAAAVAAALSLSLAVHCQHSAFESHIRCRRVFDRQTDSTRPAPLGAPHDHWRFERPWSEQNGSQTRAISSHGNRKTRHEPG